MELYEAVMSNSLPGVMFLLDRGVNIESRYRSHKTVLHIAVEQNYTDLVKLLLQRGAYVNVKDRMGKTPLHYARSETVIRDLIYRGANMNGKDRMGNTPLHYARTETVMRELLNRGADVNRRNESGQTPLYMAISSNCAQSVSMLLEFGASVNIEDENNITPLYAALSTRNLTIMEELLIKGADVNIIQENGNTIFFSMVENGCDSAVELALKTTDVNLKLGNGRTPLHTGCTNGRIVDLLVAHGVDLEARDEDGQTPLLYARQLPSDTLKSTVPLLVDKGANVRASDNQGNTILHDPNISKGLLELLLNKGADPNAQDRNGKTPFHLAVNFLKKFEFIFTKGGNINIKDHEGKTPFQLLAIKHLRVDNDNLNTKTLLSAVNDDGNTLLHLATTLSCETLTSYLLEQGANVDTTNHNGITPLHRAVIVGNLKIVKKLLQGGASINMQNGLGETPLHLAVEISLQNSNNNCNLIEELLARGARMDITDNKQNTSLSRSRWRRTLEEILLKHVVKLKLVNVEEHFMCNIEVYMRQFTRFIASCAEELDRMKTDRFGYVSVFNVLSMYKDPSYVLNIALAQKIQSSALQSEYPIYGLILKVLFEKAEKRKLLLDTVKFNVSAKLETTSEDVKLPVEIRRMILSELTNEDLERVIEAEN